MKFLISFCLLFFSRQTFSQQDSTRNKKNFFQVRDSAISYLSKDLNEDKRKIEAVFLIILKSVDEMNAVANKNELVIEERDKKLMLIVSNRNASIRKLLTEEQFEKLKAFMVKH